MLCLGDNYSHGGPSPISTPNFTKRKSAQVILFVKLINKVEVETSHQNVLFLSAVLKVIHQKISIMLSITNRWEVEFRSSETFDQMLENSNKKYYKKNINNFP